MTIKHNNSSNSFIVFFIYEDIFKVEIGSKIRATSKFLDFFQVKFNIKLYYSFS